MHSVTDWVLDAAQCQTVSSVWLPDMKKIRILATSATGAAQFLQFRICPRSTGGTAVLRCCVSRKLR